MATLDRNVKDKQGQRFGRLVVIDYAGIRAFGTNGRREAWWVCRCDCGNIATIRNSSLIVGRTQSCGCLFKETHAPGLKHAHPIEYQIWSNIKQRCYNPQIRCYPAYGGRGIKMIEVWRESFAAFLQAMGLRPTRAHSVGRIDNDGDYEPDNCKWMLPPEQANNKRSSRLLTYNGETLTVAQWAPRIGIKRSALYARLRYGWTVEQILTTRSLRDKEAMDGIPVHT